MANVKLSKATPDQVKSKSLTCHDTVCHNFDDLFKAFIVGWEEILKMIFGIIEIRDWNFFRYSIVLKIRY